MSDDYDVVLSRRAVALSAVLHGSRRLGAHRPLGTTPTPSRGHNDGPDADRFFPAMGDWMHRAACRDANPAVFDVHSDDSYGRGSIVAARTTALTSAAVWCAHCPVIAECAQEGTRHESGVWGGQVKDGGRVVSSQREPRPPQQTRPRSKPKERTRAEGESSMGARKNTPRASGSVGYCDVHDKYSYASAKDAKKAGNYVGKVEGKQVERGPIRSYPCDVYPRSWHWGHSSLMRQAIVTEARASQAPILRAMAAAMSTTKGQNTMTATISNPTADSEVPTNPHTTATPVEISPELAAEWLMLNTHNRPVRDADVKRYATLMTQGRWVVNGDSIRWSVANEVLDGQHRLMAVVESGVTIRQFVTSGLPAESQDTMDVGMKRTVGDQLALRGYPKGKTMGSAARLAMVVHAGRPVRPSNLDVIVMVEADTRLREIVSDVLPTLPKKLTTDTVLAYVYRRLDHVDAEACAEFFRLLGSMGTEIIPSPIIALHERMTGGVKPAPRVNGQWGRSKFMTPNSDAGKLFDVTCFFLAWNAWRKGEDRDMIRPQRNADGQYTVPDPV